MKIRLLFFALLASLSNSSFSQIKISGQVATIDNEALENVSVYFNNTTIGTITNEKGEFELNINDGSYTLVISILGYKVKYIPINSSNEARFLKINLEEDTTLLDEVVLQKTKYDEDWKYNLSRFKKTFLGRTKLAEDCKIINEKDLFFSFDIKTNTLNAYSRKPLIIKNNGLGYLITFDLVDFTITGKQFSFTGFAQYKNMKQNVRKKWIANRLVAYNGSRMHFLRSLILKNTKKEGFNLNQFRRVLNPDRPTEKEIKMAKELIKLHGSSINFSKDITVPKTALDSASYYVRKARLPKYRDYLYKKGTPDEDAISFEGEKPFLDFENHLMIIYTRESEEENYLRGMFGRRKKATGVQTSNIVLKHGKTQISKSGILMDPNTIFTEGYWGFESFANMLPLDYQPPKK